MTPLTLKSKIGYVVKRYPRYSETFIINEILAHEAAGLPIAIYSLYPPTDTHFQNVLSCVRSPVHYLPQDIPKSAYFWSVMKECGEWLPGFWGEIPNAAHTEPRELYQAMHLALAVKQEGLTHLHAHFATAPTTVAQLAAKFSGITYSFTAHAKDIFHHTVQKEVLGRKMSEATAVVTISNFNGEYLRSQFGKAAARVVRIYNGLDLDRFKFSPPVRRSRRIIAVGRLVEKKGFTDLIHACARLRLESVEFECLIAGAGEMENRLRNQIHELRLQDQIHLIGPRPQADLMELVQSAAVLAAPCVVSEDGNRDGLPTVLLEAMALGTPCVATPVTGIPEVVRHERTGLLVPSHDPQRLAAALQRLLNHHELRIHLAAQARQLIDSEFDIQQNANQLRKFFAPGNRSGILAYPTQV